MRKHRELLNPSVFLCVPYWIFLQSDVCFILDSINSRRTHSVSAVSPTQT